MNLEMNCAKLFLRSRALSFSPILCAQIEQEILERVRLDFISKIPQWHDLGVFVSEIEEIFSSPPSKSVAIKASNIDTGPNDSQVDPPFLSINLNVWCETLFLSL